MSATPKLVNKLCCFLSLLALLPAHALVVDNTRTLNETAPANGAPWNNVGSGNGASAVYLRNGWVISARHVFGGTTSPVVTFDGVSYSGGTIFVLDNADTNPSDVVMFNIGATPAGTTAINVSTVLPNTNSSLTMIGFGSKRSGELVQIRSTDRTDNGYLWGAAGRSWGTNLRNLNTQLVRAGQNNAFHAFSTTFQATGSSDKAQAAVGDSGGGVFSKSGNVWSLAGTMNAIGGYAGQQGGTAANGNATFAADMSIYAPQINAKLDSTTPRPVLNAVSPDTLFVATRSQMLTVTGSQFVNGAKVQIAPGNNPNSFTEYGTTFVDASTLRVSVIVSEAQTWRVRVVNPDGQPSGTANVVLKVQSYSNWLNSYPTLTQTEPTADEDGDGLVNLQEYAFGSDPTSAASAQRPTLGQETVNGQKFLTITFLKDTSKSDVTYLAETTTDLNNAGSWITVQNNFVEKDGILELRKAAVPLDGTSRFLRVRVTR